MYDCLKHIIPHAQHHAEDILYNTQMMQRHWETANDHIYATELGRASACDATGVASYSTDAH